MFSQATVALAIVFAIAAEILALHPLSDAFIDHINSLNATWKAGRNLQPGTPLSDLKIQLEALISKFSLPEKTEFLNTKDLPDNFDSREKWPYCPSLNEIRDQSRCGSCWAHASSEMMTDRYCIHTEGKKQFHFSAEDLTTCLPLGCEFGYPSLALQHWKEHGVASGGNYGSDDGCRPYSIESCDITGQDKSNLCKPYVDTPKCERSCQSNYNITYKDDLKYGKDVYSIHTEENIMAEIYNNGPVVGTIEEYADFSKHKTGVYRRRAGTKVDDHVIKILGWGVKHGVKYWLCANSWGPNWGEEGFFKIVRGSNHCGIEDYVVAGIPVVD